MTEKDDTKSVGYRNPPKHSRFQPGQSGNPSGRPKGTRNFLTEIREELNAEIERPDGADRVRITKQQAIVKAFIAKAIGGDIRAITALISYSTPANGGGDEDDLLPDEEKLLAEFERREAERQKDQLDQGNIDTESSSNE